MGADGIESRSAMSSMPAMAEMEGTKTDTPPPLLRHGLSTPLERLRVRAFELYCNGTGTLGEIARSLSCSKQYLYKVAKQEDWATRKARLQAQVHSPDDDRAGLAMDLARSELQTKVHTRLLELEKRCEKGDLRAIVAWLKLAGVDKPDGRSKAPSGVDVLNDVSDHNQVRVVGSDGRPVPSAHSDGTRTTPGGEQEEFNGTRLG